MHAKTPALWVAACTNSARVLAIVRYGRPSYAGRDCLCPHLGRSSLACTTTSQSARTEAQTDKDGHKTRRRIPWQRKKTLHYEWYVKTLDGATMQQDMCRTRTFGSTSVRQLVSCFSRVVPTSFRSAVDSLMTLKSLWLLPSGWRIYARC